MILIDEITAERGDSTVVQMQAIDFAKLIRDRHEAVEHAREYARKTQDELRKMERDVEAERERHEAAERDACNVAEDNRDALRVLSDAVRSGVSERIASALSEAERVLKGHEPPAF